MLSHLRRRIGVLTAVAVLAALVPTLSTAPVGAVPATTAITATTIDAAPDYLACPTSASIPSAGFTDTTDTAVDCIKYYGITSGTTATTYSPTDSVTRWQMALYITRLLDVANVTLGTGADQGFTDISGKSDEIVTAINQIKQLGITVGTNTEGTLYSPDSNVSREQMALFIERMLDNLPAGPGGVSETELVGGAATTYINSNCALAAACTGKYNYTDVDSGSVTVEASNSIKELFTLGIHDGVSATTFNPGSDMTRAAMATFLTAALNHTNVRPEGLHLQAVSYSGLGTQTPGMSVSYRDASFDPIASAPVDVFYWTNSTTEGNTSFLASGLCSTSYTAPTADSITECKIDTTETGTDESGNMVPTANGTTTLGGAGTIYVGTDTYHAWTAASSTSYDNDLHGEAAAPNTHSSIDVVANPAAAAIRCSMDTPTNVRMENGVAEGEHTVPFGRVTTITCQATNGTAATSGAVPLALAKIEMNHSRVFTTDGSLLSPQQGDTILVSQTNGYTDANGEVIFTITGPADPSTATTDAMTDTIQLTRISGGTDILSFPLAGKSGHMVDGANTLSTILEYEDVTAAINSVTLTQTASTGAASASGVTRSVTASSWDQYGASIAAQSVTFESASELPNDLGMICSAATPTVCTSNLAHGLAVNDQLMVNSVGSTADCVIDAGAGAAVAQFTLVAVGTVPSTTTFTLVDSTGDSIACDSASTAAQPIQLVAQTFTSASRTTGSGGTASFSWVDTTATSGRDTVEVTSGGNTASVNFYRTTTAADFQEAGNDDAVLDANDVIAKLVAYDGTANTFTIEITDAATGTLVETMTTKVYQSFSYDSNDQLATGATIAAPLGTAATETAFETAMAANALVAGGTYGDIVSIDYEALSTGVSRIYTD